MSFLSHPYDFVDIASYMMSLNLLTLEKIPVVDIIGGRGVGRSASFMYA